MLTDARCRTAKPKERPYKLADSKGLYLYVSTTGFRSWRWKYRIHGKEKRLIFGPYPELSLTEAREKRDAAARLLREGLDPSIHRKQMEASRATEAGHTFETVARDWHETQRPTWTPKHAKTVIESLEAEVFPTLGNLPIGTITAPLVLQTIRAIEARAAVETAQRVRQRMSAVFVHAIASGIGEADPAATIKRATKSPRKGRRPAMRTLDQARALLKDTEAEPAHPLTKLASRLLALTAVRPGVVRIAQPDEFERLDTSDPIWRIPPEKMKLLLEEKEDEAFEFIVPLSRQAVEVVKAAQQLIGKAPYLFPNTRSTRRPMSENAIGYMYNRLPQYRGRHVPHGWRATFSTIMNELAIERERPGDRAIIDLMLAHKPPGVEGIYNRAAYMPRRRIIAQEWADMLLEGFASAEDLLKGPRK